VTLASAKSYRIADEAGAEVWTPLEAVPGLPVTARTTVGRAPPKP
jgi:hypothetical protein